MVNEIINTTRKLGTDITFIIKRYLDAYPRQAYGTTFDKLSYNEEGEILLHFTRFGSCD